MSELPMPGICRLADSLGLKQINELTLWALNLLCHGVMMSTEYVAIWHGSVDDCELPV